MDGNGVVMLGTVVSCESKLGPACLFLAFAIDLLVVSIPYRAYSPGEIKVLTSADSANFELGIGWRQSVRSEVAHDETLVFPTPRNVKAVIVVMRT